MQVAAHTLSRCRFGRLVRLSCTVCLRCQAILAKRGEHKSTSSCIAVTVPLLLAYTALTTRSLLADCASMLRAAAAAATAIVVLLVCCCCLRHEYQEFLCSCQQPSHQLFDTVLVSSVVV
eukprot:6892-Heterococcus_DN1.PRE.6